MYRTVGRNTSGIPSQKWTVLHTNQPLTKTEMASCMYVSGLCIAKLETKHVGFLQPPAAGLRTCALTLQRDTTRAQRS